MDETLDMGEYSTKLDQSMIPADVSHNNDLIESAENLFDEEY